MFKRRGIQGSSFFYKELKQGNEVANDKKASDNNKLSRGREERGVGFRVIRFLSVIKRYNI